MLKIIVEDLIYRNSFTLSFYVVLSYITQIFLLFRFQ